jgi:hypothetical protein
MVIGSWYAAAGLREDRAAHHLHRPVDEDMTGPASRDGDERRHHRREQASGVEPAALPRGVDAQRLRGSAYGRIAHRRDPVDVRGPQSGVCDRRSRSGRGQLDPGDAGPAADRRHARSGDAGTSLNA